ncbi:MAG: tetratricopeptide repeat protein [Bacteroidia bacterium]
MKHFCILIISFFLLPVGASYAGEKQKIDSLLALIPHSKPDTSLSLIYSELSKSYLTLNDNEQAKHFAELCLTHSVKINFSKGIALAHHDLGRMLFRAGKKETGLQHFDTALSIDGLLHDDLAISRIQKDIGAIHYISGEYREALQISEAALPASIKLRDSDNIASLYNNIGLANFKLGNNNAAIRDFLKAYAIAEKMQDSLLLARASSNIGMANSELGNQKDALRYSEKAIVIYERLGLKRNEAMVIASIALSHERLKNYDIALTNYRLALALFEKLEDKHNCISMLNNIAGIFIKLNQLDSAKYFNDSAYQIYLETGGESEKAEVFKWRGAVYLSLAHKNNSKPLYKEAIKYYETGLEASIAIGLYRAILECHDGLADANSALGNFETAYSHQLKFRAINDSIQKITFSKEIAEMQTKYETEKKENEITKLNSEKLLDAEKIARQKTLNFSLIVIAGLIFISGFLIFRNTQKKRTAEKQVAILEKQNAIESMRSKIASDVHDDMGANLTRLGLNAEQLLTSAAASEKEKQLAEKISLQSKEVITGMREIIWASNPANDNLKSMLGFMRQYIDRFFDGTDIRPVVNFPHDVGEITLHPEVRRNLFLILKESLNNAVKYSGSDKIDIDFSNENENFNLNIKDYGKGIDDKTKDDFSNGLRNMQMRAEQIQSLFKLVTAPGSGVHILVEGKLY